MNRRILIVDDEKVLCRSLALAFTDDGFDVGTAHSGEEALATAEVFQPPIVLLDLRLPGMDGIHVLEALRQQNEEMIVIMMTAYGDTQTTVEAVKRGAFNFINKPFELEEVKQLVDQAVETLSRNREFEYLKYQQRRFYQFCDLVGESPPIEKGLRPDRNLGPDRRRHHPYPGGKRDRQGTGGQRHPLPRSAQQGAPDGNQLRLPARIPSGKRTVRL